MEDIIMNMIEEIAEEENIKIDMDTICNITNNISDDVFEYIEGLIVDELENLK